MYLAFAILFQVKRMSSNSFSSRVHADWKTHGFIFYKNHHYINLIFLITQNTLNSSFKEHIYYFGRQRLSQFYCRGTSNSQAFPNKWNISQIPRITRDKSSANKLEPVSCKKKKKKKRKKSTGFVSF